jgi:hypothetical protein
METIPVDAFLASYPDAIREAAETLRALVRRAVPSTIERVRPGWRLIGYDLPLGQKSRFFAYVAPEPAHIHLGFQYGAWMADPERQLRGAHLRLQKVRYLTFRPGESIPRAAALAFTREAARVAAMSTQERMSLALDREWQPEAAGRSPR